MKVDNKTYFNIKDIDNVQFFGDIFLGYPEFRNVEILGATYNGLDMDENEVLILNNDRGLVQAIALNYLSSIVDLDNIG